MSIRSCGQKVPKVGQMVISPQQFTKPFLKILFPIVTNYFQYETGCLTDSS